MREPARVARLVIVNAPHPFIVQRSLFDSREQRAASQYITRFRDTSLDQGFVGAGIEKFFASTFAHLLTSTLMGAEKAAYLDEWGQPGAMTAMLNWYRATDLVVPAVGDDAPRPAFLDAPLPPVTQPTLVVWGMDDTALLPIQLDGLDALVSDLTLRRIDGGHFVPWENAPAVIAAMRDWGV